MHTLSELAKHVDLSEPQLRKLARDGELKATLVGKTYIIKSLSVAIKTIEARGISKRGKYERKSFSQNSENNA